MCRALAQISTETDTRRGRGWMRPSVCWSHRRPRAGGVARGHQVQGARGKGANEKTNSGTQRISEGLRGNGSLDEEKQASEWAASRRQRDLFSAVHHQVHARVGAPGPNQDNAAPRPCSASSGVGGQQALRFRPGTRHSLPLTLAELFFLGGSSSSAIIEVRRYTR